MDRQRMQKEPVISTSDRHLSKPVRLGAKNDRRVRELAEMTRKPIGRVLDELVSYALEHVNVRPVQLYDYKFDE